MYINGYALLVGVGDYKFSSLSVPVTANDAEEIYKVFTDITCCNYPEENVFLLSNSDATSTRIVEVLRYFKKQISEDENATLVVFFSGHGFLFNDQYFLLTHEAELINLSNGLWGIEPSTALANDTFIEEIRSIKYQRLVVFINTCFSGSVGSSLDLDFPVELSPALLENYNVLLKGEGRVIISSSKPEQKSWIKANEPVSIFTKHILAGLKGAAYQKGDKIGVFELFEYISEQIPRDAMTINVTQTPVIKAYDMTTNFPVSFAPKQVKKHDRGDVVVDALSEKRLWIFLTKALNVMLDDQVDSLMNILLSIREINGIGIKTRTNYLIALRRLQRLEELYETIHDIYPDVFSMVREEFGSGGEDDRSV